jgi:hypothetical protein
VLQPDRQLKLQTYKQEQQQRQHRQKQQKHRLNRQQLLQQLQQLVWKGHGHCHTSSMLNSIYSSSSSKGSPL